MSLQLSYGFNVMSPVVAKMVTDHILMSARIQAQFQDNVEMETREGAAWSILYGHLQDNSKGNAELQNDVIDELRRQFPDAAERAADDFRDWFYDC